MSRIDGGIVTEISKYGKIDDVYLEPLYLANCDKRRSQNSKAQTQEE